MPEETQVEKDKDNGSSSKATEGANKNDTINVFPIPSLEEVRPPLHLPQRLKKHNNDIQFKKFVDILDQLYINVLFLEAIEKMLTYAKFLEEIVTKIRKDEKYETVAMTKAYCSALRNARPTSVILQLVDRSNVCPEGRVEDAIVKVDKFVFPVEFLIIDCEVDATTPIILGIPFLATRRILINCEKGELTMRVADQCITINAFHTIKYMDESKECQSIFEVDSLILGEVDQICHDNFISLENYGRLIEEESADELNDFSLEVQEARYLTASSDYKSKWVEAIARPNNDSKTVLKYGVRNKTSTTPQTNGQAEVSNWEIKKILEKAVNLRRNDWFPKLDEMLWAYQTTFKTPLECHL
ncbi:uncharacterized protein LOC120144723 [Hibiscus syriacus]|uniref:uncharacterized protein LOC120144723 n=1 Tax=Hibiscus syriacus TaxID=106335 RepID=UPI0019237F52|nr:uncharacterized protein LOC120144723 [Hibiscus syriacus]